MPDKFSPSDVERVGDIARVALKLIIDQAEAELPDDPANATLNAIAVLTAHAFDDDAETQFYVATAINNVLEQRQDAIHWRMRAVGRHTN